MLFFAGTSHNGGYSHSSVVYALQDCGYRLIDTAKRYGTEEFIRLALEQCGIERKELFIISKLWPSDYGFDKTKQSLRGSLDRLGLEYIDGFLMHYPEVSSTCDKWPTMSDTWRALEMLYDQGTIKAIGVSNYEIEDLIRQEEAGEIAGLKPFINQLEYHPYHRPEDVIKYCNENGIQVQGYCPLGNGNLISEPIVTEISKQVNKTPAQVLIRWSLQHSVPTIPKSVKKNRVQENFDVFNFCLTAEQMLSLDDLNRNLKYVEVENIKDKIDSNQPDGYRLDANLRENILQT